MRVNLEFTNPIAVFRYPFTRLKQVTLLFKAQHLSYCESFESPKLVTNDVTIAMYRGQKQI